MRVDMPFIHAAIGAQVRRMCRTVAGAMDAGGAAEERQMHE